MSSLELLIFLIVFHLQVFEGDKDKNKGLMRMGIPMIISLRSIRHLVGLGSPGAVKSNTNGFRSNR